MKIHNLAMAVIAAALLAAACQVPSAPSSGGKASLTINVSNQINARTLAPGLGMNPASYTVTGTGPAGATFTVTTSGGPVTRDHLAFGSWTVVVNATNSGGTLIGTGSATTQVNTASTSTVSVTVTPVSGVGTLNLGVSWPNGSVQTPSIDSTLTPALGSAQTLPFSISGSSASYSNNAVGNGYYTLALTVKDTGVVVAGAVDVVRIVTGQTTGGTYAFSQVNAPGGTIQVNVDANLQNPLDVAISGASANQTVGTTKTLTASVSNYSGNVVYVWYVNGVSAGTGSTFDFSSGSVAGYSYRIDVTAFSADGTRGGSATTTVGAIGASDPVLPASFTNYTTANGLGGNFVNAVTVDGSTIYASTDNGLSVSSNNGATWTNYLPDSGTQGGNYVFAAAVSGSTIYAATGGAGLAVSTNGGASWTMYTTLNGLGNNAIFSLALSGSTIYAGTISGVSVSTDGGASWTNSTTANGLGSDIIYNLAVSGSTIYAATEGGLSVSNNGGVSWTNYNAANGLGADQVYGVALIGSAIYASTGGGVSKSTNGGASWTTYTSANGLGNDFVYALTASGTTLYAGNQYQGIAGGLSVSTNGGVSWTNYTTAHGLGSNGVYSIAVSGSTIYATTSNGLSISQ